MTGREPMPTPEVVAVDTGRHLVIVCPYCAELHFHGRGDGAAYGHRVAHCRRKVAENPGYVLVRVAAVAR